MSYSLPLIVLFHLAIIIIVVVIVIIITVIIIIFLRAVKLQKFLLMWGRIPLLTAEFFFTDVYVYYHSTVCSFIT